MTAAENIVYNTAQGAFMLLGGNHVTVVNNIFFNDRLATFVAGLWNTERIDGLVARRNIIGSCQGDPFRLFAGAASRMLALSTKPESLIDSGENLFWHCGEPVRITVSQNILKNGPETKNYSLEEWQKTGREKRSVVVDPQFKSLATGDFTMPADSPAFRSGFRAINTARRAGVAAAAPAVNDSPTRSLQRLAVFLEYDEPMSVTDQGSWETKDAVISQSLGLFKLHQRVASAPDARMSFSAPVPENGHYAAYLRWYRSGGVPAKNVPVAIAHAQGVTKTIVDQGQEGHKWVKLGEFLFEKGRSAVIAVSGTGDGEVSVNAVALVRQRDQE